MAVQLRLPGAAGLLASLAATAAAAPLAIPTKEIASGVNMPVLSIGTGGLESSSATQIVTNWLGLGGLGIDAALVYKNQESVREALNESGIPRENLFITTKIPGCADAASNIEKDFKQLGVDYIDLLLIHFPSPECVWAWDVLEDYTDTGRVRAIGVSNFKTADLQAILKVARVKPAVNQIEHNLLNHDDETIAFCQKNGIAIESYSPVGRANHSGDISGNAAIQNIGASHNRSTYQVALRWIVQHGHLLTFQSTSAVHQAADADVFGFELTKEEMSILDGLQQLPALVV